MEVVGRFPKSNEEQAEYKVFGNIPVWLPTRTECSQFNTDVKGYIKCLRKVVIVLIRAIWLCSDIVVTASTQPHLKLSNE